ncbi:MAG: DUF2332 family protein, partial [Alphaproteobacteria bacterium]|nr:DUF2332 family protein [Alphaproteobacteria bacterium]
MAGDNPNIAEFRRQARACHALNSPLTGEMLDAAANVLDEASETGRRVLGWTGDPMADALPLRLSGGLHGLARRNVAPRLSKLYLEGTGDFSNAIREAIDAHDAWLAGWLDSPPQTNEVGRSGALMSGLMQAAYRLGLPIELFELGASAGLNLNLDRFRFDLGKRAIGPEDSPVRIAPVWTGGDPPDAKPVIIARAAVDQRPVNVRDDAAAERLIAYVWADQKERIARLEAAMEIARKFPPPLVAADAGPWLEQQLPRRQPEGVLRIVMHSVFWQYVPPA